MSHIFVITEASSVYTQNLIRSSTITFDQPTNQKINKLIESFHASCICQLQNSSQTSRNTGLLLENLSVLTDCLNVLYAEESVFYDETKVLATLVPQLTELFKNKLYPFQKEQESPLLHKLALT